MKNGTVEIHGKDVTGLFAVVDLLFMLFIVVELAVFPLLPLLPLVVSAVALTTRLRSSRWRLVTLWSLAAVLTLCVLAPFVPRLFDFNFVENGPVHSVG